MKRQSPHTCAAGASPPHKDISRDPSFLAFCTAPPDLQGFNLLTCSFCSYSLNCCILMCVRKPVHGAPLWHRSCKTNVLTPVSSSCIFDPRPCAYISPVSGAEVTGHRVLPRFHACSSHSRLPLQGPSADLISRHRRHRRHRVLSKGQDFPERHDGPPHVHF